MIRDNFANRPGVIALAVAVIAAVIETTAAVAKAAQALLDRMPLR
jgi:hypothetical protein